MIFVFYGMDRSWVKNGKTFTGPYIKGVNEFMKFVRDHNPNEDDTILCPCSRCVNLLWHNQATVENT